MKIKVLNDHVVNQIAAGEVVERPESVVRELVDNALDSGATEISVAVEAGGSSLISVRDDGCGMEQDDALLAFERHATSKLSCLDDFTTLQTLGFRGEALPAIASVAKVHVLTRAVERELATELEIVAGKIERVQACAGPKGTCVTVRGLFYNIPARRKFLKSSQTESQRIKTWLSQIATIHPNVSFRLSIDGRDVLNLSRKQNVFERAASQLKGAYVSFEQEFGSIRLQGVLGHPALALADANSLSIFVNGRLINDRMLVRAIKEGFFSALKEREYPIGFLAVWLPGELVDVNVHPRKCEVRFRDGQALFVAVRTAVAEAVKGFTRPLAGETFKRSQMPQCAASESVIQTELTLIKAVGSNSASAAFDSPSSESKCSESKFRFSSLRYVGQVLDSYLICESDSLYLIDMHAAHERYNYNLIRNGFRDRVLETQLCLTPICVDLSSEALQNCLTHTELFERFGFLVEAYGDTTLLVRGVPNILVGRDVSGVIKELAACSFSALIEGRFEQELDLICARLACHASVRAGRVLQTEEVYELFAALDQSEFSAACPHGRPVALSFSNDEIGRWFGRDR